ARLIVRSPRAGRRGRQQALRLSCSWQPTLAEWVVPCNSLLPTLRRVRGAHAQPRFFASHLEEARSIIDRVDPVVFVVPSHPRAARCQRSDPTLMSNVTRRHTMKTLVTGGTGTLGKRVVARLCEAGNDVRVLSRHGNAGRNGIELVTGDLATGEGAEAAVAGTEIIVHCAGTNNGDDDKARHLVKAAARAGVKHVVFISVVGADRIPASGGIDR